MLGVILFDSSQRIPIYWSPRMTREFVDGVLDVVLADRASQFSYVVGPPAMYRGSIVQSSSSNQNNNNSHQNDSSSSPDQNGNLSSPESAKKISNALLHSSLLCGVVESHGKIAHEQQQQQQASMMNGGDGFNSSTTTRGSDVAGSGSGFIRPPHYPRLVRSKNTVPLTKTAVSPTCPNVSRFVQTQAPTPLTKAQINSSKALNEGCVALSSNSQHSWLHPSIAPCSTEPVTDWILSYEQSHLRNQSDLKRERIQSYSKLVQEYQKLRVEHQQQQQHQQNNNISTPASNEKYIPSMFYFPWRIFGDSLGVVYCIFSAGPNVPLASNNIPIITTSSSSSSSSPLKKQNSFTTMKANGGGSQNDLLTLAAGGQHQGGSSSSFAHSASQQGNFLTSDSFAGFFGGGGQHLYASSASPDASPTRRGGNSHHHHQSSIDPTILSSLPKHFHHEENMPAVQQSMSNLLVLLCDAFKTTKSTEAPTCKSLISNLDQVHECVEIVCPGNGRCMPVLDTSAVRKVWKMRNEYAN